VQVWDSDASVTKLKKGSLSLANSSGPRKINRQPKVGRLSSRVNHMKSSSNKPVARLRDSRGRFISASSRPSQKRDKYGRFVKVNRVGITKKNPARLRDSNGRFITASQQRQIYRDKRGRFSKPPLPWHRRKVAMALPLLIGVVGLLFFAYELNRPIIIDEPVAAQESQPEPQQPEISEVTVTLPKSEPTRLRIPKIDVDTTFVELGKNRDGTLEVPKNYDLVGWYNGGPTPGELGPAVVAGHVSLRNGTAVFRQLYLLAPGDKLTIDRKDGTTATFKVTKVKQVPQNSDFPTEAVYGNIDHAGIRLITCGGAFNRNTGKYSHNTVVFGQLVTDKK
jgi:sortase (surface protein transpeptidase)